MQRVFSEQSFRLSARKLRASLTFLLAPFTVHVPLIQKSKKEIKQKKKEQRIVQLSKERKKEKKGK